MNFSITSKKHRFFKVLFTLFVVFTAFTSVQSQTMDRVEKGRMKDILNTIKNEVKAKYYDPNFHGIDLDARVKKAEERLEQVTTVAQAFSVIAQVLVDFNDSHLRFIPPSTNLLVEYPWQMQMIGDRCYVTSVRTESDAEAKGLKVGDRILEVEGFRPNRKEFWKVFYYYYQLSIREKLKLTVISPDDEQPRVLEIKSKLKKKPQVVTLNTNYKLFNNFYNEENGKSRTKRIGDIFIWKLPSFGVDWDNVAYYMEMAKKGNYLILDLRGNGGGFVKTMEKLTGWFFEKDIHIAELKGRKKMDPQKAESKGKGIFTGKVIVLIDHESASASEIFSRVIQLEKRGIVLGDISAGAVMQSLFYPFSLGDDKVVQFWVNITNADVIMADGKSLEHVGVIPDEIILPSGSDLANQRDPVLARAVELLGGKLSADEAGKFFKFYWSND